MSSLAALIDLLEKGRDAACGYDKLVNGVASERSVYEMDARDIVAKSGVKNATAEAIDLVDDLTRYCLSEAQGVHPRLDSVKAAGEYFSALMYGRHEEYFYLGCLGKRGSLISVKLMQKGTLDSAVVYVRDIVQELVRAGASGAVLAHNHPGGTLKPSWADVELTRKVKDSLSLIGIELVEHVIVTNDGSVGIIGEGYL